MAETRLGPMVNGECLREDKERIGGSYRDDKARMRKGTYEKWIATARAVVM
jgi:hypothetical protein